MKRPGKLTRLVATMVASVALMGGLIVALAAAPAGAGTCGTPAASCTTTGTLTLTPGSLQLTAPATLAWSATLTGTDQYVADTNAGDQSYVVNDATGTGAGWNVTATSTTFTSGSETLPDTSFSTNGSPDGQQSDTASPSPACTSGASCTVADNALSSYPITIPAGTTPPTAVKIFSAEAGTGIGSNTISDVGWWLHIPANTQYGSGSYTSTITLGVSSGP